MGRVSLVAMGSTTDLMSSGIKFESIFRTFDRFVDWRIRHRPKRTDRGRKILGVLRGDAEKWSKKDVSLGRIFLMFLSRKRAIIF